jgi:hypothetical protein
MVILGNKLRNVKGKDSSFCPAIKAILNYILGSLGGAHRHFDINGKFIEVSKN